MIRGFLLSAEQLGLIQKPLSVFGLGKDVMVDENLQLCTMLRFSDNSK